jgi:hypothetical protein
MEQDNLPFGIKRKIVEELRNIENFIINQRLSGWVGYTEVKNDHIMVMYTKLKAKPYAIDLQNKLIWFRKELPCVVEAETHQNRQEKKGRYSKHN